MKDFKHCPICGKIFEETIDMTGNYRFLRCSYHLYMNILSNEIVSLNFKHPTRDLLPNINTFTIDYEKSKSYLYFGGKKLKLKININNKSFDEIIDACVDAAQEYSLFT